jgi:hypothetical protein
MTKHPYDERSASRAWRVLGLVACAGMAAVAFCACSGPKDGELFVGTFPNATTFKPVSAPLEARCGTLDCHGSFARNMRIFGKDGIRASEDTVSGIQDTTDEEVQLNYESVVSIEPEKLSGIVSHAGQNFDKWIVITKGSGAEHHKGGSRFAKGDDTYRCLLSWVTGAVDMNACAQSVATFMRPGAMPPGTDPSSSGQPPDGTPPQP